MYGGVGLDNRPVSETTHPSDVIGLHNLNKRPRPPGTIDATRYAEANAFFLKAGLINKPIKTEHSLDASAWK